MRKELAINNMALRSSNGKWEVLAPQKRVGKHPSYYSIFETFNHRENAVRFMRVTTTFLTEQGKKTLKNKIQDMVG